jgi:hypothetical protein
VIAGAVLVFYVITHFGKKWLENRL